MKLVMTSLALATCLTACGGVDANIAAPEAAKPGPDSGAGTPAAASPLAQFETELLTRLHQRNSIAAIGNDARDCKPGEDADFCRREWLRFADGARLSIDSTGKYDHPITETVYSNVVVTQDEPQAASFSSECLTAALDHAQEAGLELTYFDRLFTDTTAFFGFAGSANASIDLADGTCYVSWN